MATARASRPRFIFNLMKLLDSNIIIYSYLNILPIEINIIEKAIELRKQYKLKSADSIIAATGLIYDLELYTRNMSDFGGITGLKIVNPIP